MAAGLIALTSAEIGAINDDPACWPPRIEIDRCRYGAFLGDNAPTDAKSRIEWLSRIPTEPGEFRPDAYEHCAKVLREMGHVADAREILIEKERLQLKARRERVKRDDLNFGAPLAALLWLRDATLGATVRYGRQPLWAFAWLAGMWLLGAWIFQQAEAAGAIKPNLPQVQLHHTWTGCTEYPQGQLACFMANPEAASYPRFNALIYSADTLIPVVSLEMQSYWIPDDRTDRGMLVRAYLWFHIFMGWALTLLAVAGFSGLIKTDSK